jgi:chaperonin GroES
MPTVTPMGSRILIKDDEPLTGLEARARESKLHVVLFEQNLPKATSGIIVAIGPDPILQTLKVGDRVIFARYAGTHITVQGQQYRSLEYHEIISVIRDEPEQPEQPSQPSQDTAS